jgi:hypothetical protein
MSATGIYIYGIVPNFYGTTHFQSLENSGVYAITYQNISAIVADRDGTVLNYNDRESLGYLLVNHQETIEELQKKGFTMIIPMRLGTIAGSVDEVLNILTCGHNLIINTLKEIEYLTEIDLVATWADFPSVLTGISTHPDIIALKEEIQSHDGQISMVEQVKAGMLMKEILDTKNKDAELKILNALSAFGLDIKMHEVMNDQMIVNAAFLINRAKTDKFHHAIDQLDESYKDLLNFKLVGPLPCYSFFTLEVKEVNPELVVNARKRLGIKEKTTESEIKKAYLEKAKLFHPDNNPNDDDTENFNLVLKDYHTLLDCVAAARQTSKEEVISLSSTNISENMILVKIKD